MRRSRAGQSGRAVQSGRARRAGVGAVAGAAVLAAAGVLAAAPAQAATTVALWNMGDTGSTMKDASGHGHTGTLHRVGTGAAGYNGGGAFSFTTKPAYVTVPSAGDLNPGSSSFGITLHVKYPSRPSAAVGDYDLLRKGFASTAGGDYKVEILGNGRAYCEFRGSAGTVSATSASAPSTGSWHTISCSRTATSVTVKVDGAATTRSGKSGTIANSGSLYIGARDSSGGDQYTGTLDAVSLTKG